MVHYISHRLFYYPMHFVLRKIFGCQSNKVFLNCNDEAIFESMRNVWIGIFFPLTWIVMLQSPLKTHHCSRFHLRHQDISTGQKDFCPPTEPLSSWEVEKNTTRPCFKFAQGLYSEQRWNLVNTSWCERK